MNRQEMLLAARDECLRSFARLMPDLIKRSADALFSMAGQSKDYAEQRVLLDAYGALQKRAPFLRQRLEQGLADLTGRAINTAYNSERPSAARAVSFDTLSLVESWIIEDELKLARVTSRFHEKSGSRIHQLNLRIASLFQQELVKERENPFRPYLFSRCIASAVRELELAPEASQTTMDQLTGELLPGVDETYKLLNAFFEKHGVTTRLPAAAKPARMPARVHSADTGGAADADHREPREEKKAGHRVEQLLRVVRGGANRGDERPSQGSGQAGSASPGRRSEAWGAQAGGDSAAFGESADAPPFLNTATLSEGWVSGTHIVGQALKKLLTPRVAQQGAGHAGYSPAPIAIPPESSVYHLLKEAPATSLEEVLDNDGEVRNLIFEKRASLLAKAGDSNEMMTIDVVGMIFEFILRDPEVPAEVRAQLGRLQLLMLKIALLDPQLLTERTHPARRLINRIGTVAQGVKQNDPFGDRLTGEIHRIVEALLEDTSDTMVSVARLLDEFEEFIARELRSGDANIERAVEAIEEAEQRSARLARMAAQMEEALAAVKTEMYLHTFLTKTWVRAIEKAERDHPEPAARYRQLVPDLVWSIYDKRTDQERSQLVSLLPKMLSDLKAGMESVKAAEKQAFLGWLIDRHTHAVKATGPAEADRSLATIRQQFERFTGGSATDAASDEVVFEFDRRFIDDAIAELKVQLNGIDGLPEFAAERQQRQALLPDDEIFSEERVLDRLTAGVPVEIDFGGTPQRALLNWVNRRATNMLLSFEGNSVPAMITVTLFRRLLANGRARFPEVAPLFERAITSLLETADRVDGAYG